MQRRPRYRLLTLLVLLSGSVVTSFPLSSQTAYLDSGTTNVSSSADESPEQTRQRKVQTTSLEVVKVDVDLVTIDALVMQKNTARIVGDLTRDDFIILEDGKRQEITHFSQGSLPLSVLLLIDRGGCLDPFNDAVRHAAVEALARLKPIDEVAVMAYDDSPELLQTFTRDRALIERSLYRIPPHDEEANHCLNKVFYEAANFMERASNPSGRRVMIFITAVTSNLDCSDGPHAKEALHALYESGSVVCGVIPSSAGQKIENGLMHVITGIGGVVRSSLDLNDVAAETGGEILHDKPTQLDRAFTTLIDHLRSRFSLAFVSSNKARDGSVRKLKVEMRPAVEKSRGKLVVKARRSYVAPGS